jgi:hypothetical protein
MAHSIRSSALESRSARLKLAKRGRPYWVRIGRGLTLGYRRIETAGPWIVRKANGMGGRWIKNFTHADDYEESNGDSVLTFFEAQSVARKIADDGGFFVQVPEKTRAALIKQKYLFFIERGIKPVCCLYRLYHPNGDLLYVGISLEALRRQTQHKYDKDWYGPEVCQILIEPFAMREEAIEAERIANRTEFPKYNITHNRRRHPIQELIKVTQEFSRWP